MPPMALTAATAIANMNRRPKATIARRATVRTRRMALLRESCRYHALLGCHAVSMVAGKYLGAPTARARADSVIGKTRSHAADS